MSKEPSPQQISTLVAQFQKGNWHEAEKLANEMIVRYPKFSFGYKVLGMTYGNQDKHQEAFIAKKKSVELNPKDYESHNNLGMTYRDLGNLTEAKKKIHYSLKLNPNYADGWNNLGVICLDQEKYLEAENLCKKAISLNPRLAQAHSNLGMALMEQKRLSEAEDCYKKALHINPSYADAYNNLSLCLGRSGDLVNSADCVVKALTCNPNFTIALWNLGKISYLLNDIQNAKKYLELSLNKNTDGMGLDAGVWLMVIHYLEGNTDQATKYLRSTQKIKETTNLKHKSARIYWDYLYKLLNGKTDKGITQYLSSDIKETMYIIGESHSLPPNGEIVNYQGQLMKCKSMWMEGCKQWHLGNTKKNIFKSQFEIILRELPRKSKILLLIGEIDCRPDEGIILAAKKTSLKSLSEIANETTKSYISYVNIEARKYDHQLVIGGVPATRININELTPLVADQLVTIIREFNEHLKKWTINANLAFLDLYKLTNKGDGTANGQWHLDYFHLIPEATQEAFNSCLIRTEQY